MTTVTSTAHWLTWRIRFLCLVTFIVAALLPPYVPSTYSIPQEIEQTSQQFLLVEEGFLMKSSPLTSRASRMTFGEGIEHLVKDGEGIEKIARQYNLRPETIRWVNRLKPEDVIHPGDTLIILPVDGVLHRVKRGQTLKEIAELYGVEEQRIVGQNALENRPLLAEQELIIPGGKPIVEPPPVVAVVPPPAAGVSTPSAAPPPVTKPVAKPQPASPVVAAVPKVLPVAPTDGGGALHKPCSEACFITQYFHAGHYALDLQERGGGPVYAAEAGTVIRAEYGWNGGYGNVIEIDHGNGLVTLYGHNKVLYVRKGDQVGRGQQVAEMGNTGLVYGPTGIHVHFEVHLNGVKKNPLLYLE